MEKYYQVVAASKDGIMECGFGRLPLGRRRARSIIIAEEEIERIKNELQNKQEMEVNVYEIMSKYLVGSGCVYTVL